MNIVEMFSSGWKHYQAGGFSQAEQIYRQILQADPSQTEAWCLLGMTCQAQGKLPEAEMNYRRAIQLWPEHAVAQNGLAIILAQTGRLDEAAAGFQQLIRCRPTDADAHHNLGLVRGQQGQLEEAIACYQRALALRPDYASARTNLNLALEQQKSQTARLVARVRQDGRDPAAAAQALHQQALLLIQQGRFDEARVQLQQVLQLAPDHADANINLANVFVRLERYDEAIVQYRRALRLKPDHFGAHYILGIALQDKGQFAEAEAHYRQALRLNPHHADAYNSLGLTLMAQDRVDEAVSCYHQALRVQPDFLLAVNNLGAAFERQDKLDEAVPCYEQALRLDPRCAAACNNLGMVRKRQGQLDAAMACFDQAIRLEPSYASAHWNRAVLWLLRGDFEQGWKEYEWRWAQPDFGERHFVQPAWDGSALGGRTILLYAEQGLGDTLQFVRYAPLVQQRGGRVIFQCQPPLLRLLAEAGKGPKSEVRSPKSNAPLSTSDIGHRTSDLFVGIDHLVSKDSPLAAFDVHAALLSLPGIFRNSLSTLPAPIPYLYANAELVSHWRRELNKGLGTRDEGRESGMTFSSLAPRPSSLAPFLVGIAWQGNPAFREDRQRSLPAAQFAALAQVPGVQLISLQKGPGTDQLRDLGGKYRVLDLGSRLDEASGAFMDTAAVMMNLDLVISCDTAVPHLAGALGVPVWVALPLVPDWRWLLEREDSPWYPTMRLFRQTRYGHWEDVFERMAEELKAVVSC